MQPIHYPTNKNESDYSHEMKMTIIETMMLILLPSYATEELSTGGADCYLDPLLKHSTMLTMRNFFKLESKGEEEPIFVTLLCI